MESPARFTFDGPLEGNTATVFPIPAEIKGDNYCRVDLDDVIVGDLTKYDIVNNSIVFTNAADLVGVSKVSVLVVQSEEAAATFPAVGYIDTVARNIDNVNAVGVDIANVNTVAADIANVNIVAGIDTVQVSADAATASTGASTATTQAGIATTQASAASTSDSIATSAAGGAQVETVTLTSGQVSVVFTKPTANASFYLAGESVDQGRLVLGDNYTANHTTKTITLLESYPAGTKLSMYYHAAYDNVTFVTHNEYDSVALLKNANLTAGATAHTKGYYAAGDGGGASYLVVPSQAADGYGDHVLANGNVTISSTGNANVLVFPNLNAGNIGYKLVERFAHAKPIGPIIQGLNKPINDVSRGASVEQIVQTTQVTVIEAKMK